MNDFDRKLKWMAEEESCDVPDSVHTRIREVLDSLPDNNDRKKSLVIPLKARQWGALAAAVVFITVIVLPNVSRVYADTLGNIPVIGDLIRVITVRNYFMEENGYEMRVEVPGLKDTTSGACEVNDDVNELTAALVEAFCAEVEVSGDGGHGSLHITYDTVLQTEEWFTLRLCSEETSGGSGAAYHYYHIDRRSGERVILGDLFDRDGWEQALENALIDRMEAEMRADHTLVYWYEPGEDGYEGLQLTEDHDFILTEDGNLILPFDEYEIAPGFMGTPSFTVATEVFEEFLAEEYRELFS